MTMQTEPVATEPPHEPECTFCDGQEVVTVSEIKNAGGVRHSFNERIVEPPGTQCPICVLGMEAGVEVLA